MSINKEQLTIGDIVKKAIKNEIAKIHTSLPAEIVKINLNEKTVNIQPLIKSKIDGNFVNLPVISNVPIMFLRTKVALISVPINIGDTGTLFFSESSIKNWQLSGNIQNPEDGRKHHLTDCYFMPSILYDGQGLDLNTSLQIILKNGKVIIGDDGKIEIEGVEIKLGASAGEQAVLGNTLQGLINTFIGLYNGHGHPAFNTPPNAPDLATPLSGTELSNKVKIE